MALFLLLVRYILLLFSKILEATNLDLFHDVLNIRRKQVKNKRPFLPIFTFDLPENIRKQKVL